MFWYNVISHNPSYYFKMYISEITKKQTKKKNTPANAGDTGSSPGLGRSHMPWSN